jgi:hypothetical protein
VSNDSVCNLLPRKLTRLTLPQLSSMSVMEFDLAHHYSPHNTLSFPDYYYDDHNTPLALSFGVGARTNPRGYRIGESMADPRDSFGVARDEPPYDHGNSRRRIAVAVSVRF